MEGSASRYPLPSHFLPDRKRKRFLAFARNDNAGKRYSRIVSLLHGKSVRRILPPFSGRRCPVGAEVGLRYRLKKNVRYAFPRFVIPSAVEGSFSLAVRRRVFDSRERETPYHGRAEAVLPLKGLAKGRGKRGRKRFLAFTRNDDAKKRYSPSFLWKEVPRKGGGWLSFLRRSRHHNPEPRTLNHEPCYNKEKF